MTTKLISADGSDLRTSRVEMSDETEMEPIGWDGESLIFSGDIGDAEPVTVVYE